MAKTARQSNSGSVTHASVPFALTTKFFWKAAKNKKTSLGFNLDEEAFEKLSNISSVFTEKGFEGLITTKQSDEYGEQKTVWAYVDKPEEAITLGAVYSVKGTLKEVTSNKYPDPKIFFNISDFELVETDKEIGAEPVANGVVSEDGGSSPW